VAAGATVAWDAWDAVWPKTQASRHSERFTAVCGEWPQRVLRYVKALAGLAASETLKV
jgi:hypothetical protein